MTNAQFQAHIRNPQTNEYSIGTTYLSHNFPGYLNLADLLKIQETVDQLNLLSDLPSY